MSLGIVRGFEAGDERWRGGVLTIGNYDGVHLGHRAILTRCVERARACGTTVIVMTFDPHPAAILAPQRAPPVLTPTEAKAALLLEAGADGVVVVPVDRSFLSMTAEAFVEHCLVERLRPRWIVEGPDFGFGRGRQGNVETLRSMAAGGGFEVEVVAPVEREMEGGRLTVSSTAIREMLQRGEVEQAQECLGRYYVLLGRVVRGAGVGRSHGYPTINLDHGEQLAPGDGVYAGVATFTTGQSEKPGVPSHGLSRFAAAISIGRRETFGGTQRVVEAHLLGALDEWYDQEVRLGFVRRLRDQRRFASAQDLAKQIADDVEMVRKTIQL